MDIELIEIFPTLVGYASKIIDENQANDIKDYCLNSPLAQEVGFPMTGNGLSIQPGIDIDFLGELEKNISSCKNLKHNLSLVVNSYSESHGLPPMFITNSWFNIQNEGSVLEQHTHPNSSVSCALYINVDENSSSFVCENPNPYMWNTFFYDKNKKYSTRYVYFNPKIGDLILFPSWLKHGSKQIQNKTHNRVVISFNCWQFNNSYIN